MEHKEDILKYFGIQIVLVTIDVHLTSNLYHWDISQYIFFYVKS